MFIEQIVSLGIFLIEAMQQKLVIVDSSVLFHLQKSKEGLLLLLSDELYLFFLYMGMGKEKREIKETPCISKL